MRSGTIAFLSGILCVQVMVALPDAAYVQFLPLGLLAAALSPQARIAALFLAGALWCLLRAHLALAEVLPPHLKSRDLVAEGTIAGIPEVQAARTRFLFLVSRSSLLEPQDTDRGVRAYSGRVRLNWYGAPRLRAGQQWRLVLRLRPPRGFANPGGFDYEKWLFANGIRATGYVRDAPTAQLLGAGSPWNIDRWRQHIAERIAETLPADPAAGIVTALAVGERHAISSRQWSVLRDTGTAHLMAISGLHVALVAGFGFYLGRHLWSRFAAACLFLPAPKAGALVALMAGTGYAAMAGFSLPTQRALILLGVLMWCRICGRNTSFSVALCLALLAVLVADPLSVLGPSLWLSFGAVAVLAFGMMHRIPVRDTAPATRLWWTWGRAQFIVAVGLAPLLMLVFGQLPLAAPVANAVAIPWTGFLIVPAAIGGALLVSVSPAAGGALLKVAGQGVSLLWPLLDWIEGANLILGAAGPVTLTAGVMAAVGAALLILPREVPARWLGAILMLPLLMARPPQPAPHALWVTLLDVGHGLAVVVRTRNHILVFDTGPVYRGGFDAGRQIVAPFLRNQGVTRIDTVVLSHADWDHAGGLAGLTAEIPAMRILGPEPDVCVAGQAWRWDGYLFSMMHPAPGDRFNGNNGSCVLKVSGPGGSLLITGDIEAAAESRLIHRFGGRLRSDILIVPHHGSHTSSTASFIEQVRPDLALVSNGDGGRRRRPHPQVLKRYQRAGIAVMETAREGAISVELDADRGASPPRGYRRTARRYWRQVN